jgi:acetyl-CoA C-acetyltransferase
VLASPRAVQRYDLKPIARILGGAWAGVDSWRFVEGPAPAIRKLLRKLDASLDSFDLIENNEAFALNNVLLRRLLEIPYEKMNVHGGAIALGHPIGASGARILVTLVHALRAHGKPRGLATLCHGVGGATALAVELL